jgi:hypothetical protein
MEGIEAILLAASRLLEAREHRNVAKHVLAKLHLWALDGASLFDVVGESIIKNVLDIGVVFLCGTPRVEICGARMLQRQADEYATVLSVYNKSKQNVG